jgi:hypothetical protein
MFFGDDRAWLRDFTKENCKKKAVSDIKDRALKKWAKLTEKTDGQHLAEDMTPDLWGDSIESLQTAKKIIEQSASATLKKSDAYQTIIPRLRRAILQKTKPPNPFRSHAKKEP